MPNFPNSFENTTDVYDVDVIQGLDINSSEFKEFLVRLRNRINRLAVSLNGRDGGFYGLGEYNTGMQYFPSSTDPQANYRTVTRQVVNFGALPNTATKAVNHNINPPSGTNANYIFTRIYATATDSVGFSYIPVPLADAAGNIIDLIINQTQVTITTNFDATAYTICEVVLEYIVN